MKPRYLHYEDEDGRDVLVVPMSMADSLQRTVIDDRAKRLGVTDGTDNPLGLHRPGPRMIADADERERAAAIKEKAYADAERADAEAWRGDRRKRKRTYDPQGRLISTTEEEEIDDATDMIEGAACTCKGMEYPEAYGAPGHLRMRGGQLVCVPDDLSSDAATVDPREQAYADAEAADRDAWRRK